MYKNPSSLIAELGMTVTQGRWHMASVSREPGSQYAIYDDKNVQDALRLSAK